MTKIHEYIYVPMVAVAFILALITTIIDLKNKNARGDAAFVNQDDLGQDR